MHLLLQPLQSFQSRNGEVFFFRQFFHYLREQSKIVPLGRKLQRMLPEKWHNDVFQVIPPEYLVPITVLMARARIFLEIYASAAEEFPKFMEDIFIFLHQLHVEFRFGYYAPLRGTPFTGAAEIDCKTAFSIHETDDIVGIEHDIKSGFFVANRHAAAGNYYNPADF
jgi:hypothetical protein